MSESTPLTPPDPADLGAVGDEALVTEPEKQAWIEYQKRRYPATVERFGEEAIADFEKEGISRDFAAGYVAAVAEATGGGVVLSAEEVDTLRLMLCETVLYERWETHKPKADALRAKLRAVKPPDRDSAGSRSHAQSRDAVQGESGGTVA